MEEIYKETGETLDDLEENYDPEGWYDDIEEDK